jgi:hypothetical protein
VQPSASGRDTAVHPSVGSFATSRWRTAAQRPLTTRADLQRIWHDTGHDHGFGADQALQLLTTESPRVEQPAEDRIESRLAEHHAVFDPGVLRAVALEQTTGECVPDMALAIARDMTAERRVIPLEGGRMTTLAVRAQEQAIEGRATKLAKPARRDVGQRARQNAAREVAERIASPLNPEQQHALGVLTGSERLAVLIGPAGTGKGVVIDAAVRAEQRAGRKTIGVAVAGSTAERLGTDSPALQGQTMTLDSLVARARAGSAHVGPDTAIFLDEAGMTQPSSLTRPEWQTTPAWTRSPSW